MTEAERYEKRTPKKNVKVPPQQLWMDLIAASVPTAPSHLQQHLKSMATLDNVPRKEKPFYNFTSNSLNLRGKSGEATVSEMWKYLKKRRDEQQSAKKEQQASDTQQTNGSDTAAGEVETDEIESELAEGQVETNESESGPSTDEDTKTSDKGSTEPPKSTTADKKTVKKAMKKVLKKAANRMLTVKLLRKSVQAHLDMSVEDRALLKDLVKQNLDSSSSTFVRQGKTVTLKVD